MAAVRRRRVLRVAGYAMFGVAGAAAMIWPSPSIAGATGWLVYVWAAFLTLGGLLSAAGSLTGRWLGEYLGLPLLSSAFGAYALVIAASGRVTSTAGALVLTAFGAVLVARWQDISQIRREADGERPSRVGG